jgi:hypothetical protein
MMPLDLEEIRHGVFVAKTYYRSCQGCGMMFGPWQWEPREVVWRCTACKLRPGIEERRRCAGCKERSLDSFKA